MFFPWQALLHRPHTFCRFLFLPNLPLILIIGIASQPCKLHALGIVQCSAKCFAVRAYQALCKQVDDEIARLEQELKALSPAPEPQTVSSDMKAIYDFLSQKVDVHGACLAPELIEQFVEVVTPFADYAYRWKLNTGCKKSKEERADLMAVSEKPILTFTIDFETAKRYREANKMPHQFRRAAWTDLTVEVYL